jgi:RimJ/RimL family protein N-acetyltransferase
VRAKDDQWVNNGYGPWAVLVDGDFAGWGGFQREESGTDFGLVLSPAQWGRGAEVAGAALQLGFGELGLDEVVIALPQSRKSSRVVARYGFVPDDDVTYDGVVFRQYRLTRQSWSAVDQLRRS